MTVNYVMNKDNKRIKLPKSEIEYFEIKNLFGDRDIKLKFPSIASIIVSDNGTGKTTILNSLSAVLSGNFSSLTRIEFDQINLKFKSHRLIKIRREDLYSETRGRGAEMAISRLRRSLPKALYMELISRIRGRHDIYEIKGTDLFRQAVRISGLGPSHLLDLLMRYSNVDDVTPKRIKKLKEIKELINKQVNFDVLALTTYRRVEEDIEAFGNLTEEGLGNSLIQFGMSDVKDRFEAITSQIRNASAQSYSEISGQMLNQLNDKFVVSKDMLSLISNQDQIEIILGRTGGNITDETKKSILEKIENKTIHKNKYLAYFLSKLTEVYITQKEKDNAIKDFVRIVNGYFVNKEVVYDEVQPKINIKDLANGKPIELNNLSSGEKQLIAIMSRLYLVSDEKKLAIIFDEPELSLSTEWQKKLLPDIVESGRCGLLVAATHSPFIFDNGLDHYTRDLEIHYKEAANG